MAEPLMVFSLGNCTPFERSHSRLLPRVFGYYCAEPSPANVPYLLGNLHYNEVPNIRSGHPVRHLMVDDLLRAVEERGA